MNRNQNWRIYQGVGASYLLTSVICFPVLAQAPEAYFYDEVHRLTVVQDSRTRIRHLHDDTGNIVEIKRSLVDGVAVIEFAPKKGPVGTSVRLQGVGFMASASENVVSFNGVGASVTSAKENELWVTVPEGATTGPIVVSVAGKSAATSEPFTVTQAPVIEMLAPRGVESAASDKTITVQVSKGRNLSGATFAFEPRHDPSQPQPLTVTAASVAANGTSATLTVRVRQNLRGSFVLVAERGNESSERQSKGGNTLYVVGQGADSDGDGISDLTELNAGNCLDRLRPDSDGDGFSDGAELCGDVRGSCQAQSDPCNPGAKPPGVPALLAMASGPMLSVMNTEPPQPGPSVGSAVGPAVAVFNTSPPDIAPGQLSIGAATGPAVSVMNSSLPEIAPMLQSLGEATGPAVSVRNTHNQP